MKHLPGRTFAVTPRRPAPRAARACRRVRACSASRRSAATCACSTDERDDESMRCASAVARRCRARRSSRSPPNLEDVFVAATRKHGADATRARRMRLAPAARDRAQGAAPAASRPAHVRDDHRHPDDAARAVRLRDQPRRAPSRRRPCSTRRTPAARASSSPDMLATGVVRPVAARERRRKSTTLMRRGEISVGVVIPPDFETPPARWPRPVGSADRRRRQRHGRPGRRAPARAVPSTASPTARDASTLGTTGASARSRS